MPTTRPPYAAASPLGEDAGRRDAVHREDPTHGHETISGVPAGSRASRPCSFSTELLTEENLAKVRALSQVAKRRGQTLAQMALAWTLRDPRVTSTLVGASTVAQVEQNVATLDKCEFSKDELAEIDRYATKSGINLWVSSSTV